MKIISLTGRSGTGKSYQATSLAQSRNIDAIIDDGLFIYKGRVAAGDSAKKCVSKAAAMRTALFNYDETRNDVIKAIVKYHPASLLIIGTSDRMTDLIAETLGLHKPDERIYIEDITTEEQRDEAHYWRNTHGEHVIPAPMGQLRRDFAGYFMNPVRMIRDKALGVEMKGEPAGNESGNEDRTVVRPQYSYFGTFMITERAIKDIIRIVSEKYGQDIVILGRMNNGKQMSMEIVLDVKVVKNEQTIDRCIAFQHEIRKSIEDITSFSVSNVYVRIKDIVNSREELRA